MPKRANVSGDDGHDRIALPAIDQPQRPQPEKPRDVGSAAPKDAGDRRAQFTPSLDPLEMPRFQTLPLYNASDFPEPAIQGAFEFDEPSHASKAAAAADVHMKQIGMAAVRRELADVRDVMAQEGEALALSGDESPEAYAELPRLWVIDPAVAFNRWLRAPTANGGKGFSDESVKVYSAMWGKFVRFCVQHSSSAAQANEGVLDQFLELLAVERLQLVAKLSGTQVAKARDSGGIGRQARRYLSIISRIQKHLIDLNIRTDNPAAILLRRYEIEPERPAPAALRKDSDDKLRSKVKKLRNASSDDWRALRDYAIVDLVVGSGLTSRQIRSLEIGKEHLRLSEEPPVVCPVPARRGHAKPYPVPLSREAAASLRDWLGKRAEWMIAGDVLFPSNALGDPMSTAALYRAVAQVIKDQPESKTDDAAAHLGPRTLRHTYAARQLRAGRPLRILKDWLGHRNISSTAVYKKIVPDFEGYEPA